MLRIRDGSYAGIYLTNESIAHKHAFSTSLAVAQQSRGIRIC
jgi:hypothetical protein